MATATSANHRKLPQKLHPHFPESIFWTQSTREPWNLLNPLDATDATTTLLIDAIFHKFLYNFMPCSGRGRGGSPTRADIAESSLIFFSYYSFKCETIIVDGISHSSDLLVGRVTGGTTESWSGELFRVRLFTMKCYWLWWNLCLFHISDIAFEMDFCAIFECIGKSIAEKLPWFVVWFSSGHHNFLVYLNNWKIAYQKKNFHKRSIQNIIVTFSFMAKSIEFFWKKWNNQNDCEMWERFIADFFIVMISVIEIIPTVYSILGKLQYHARSIEKIRQTMR